MCDYCKKKKDHHHNYYLDLLLGYKHGTCSCHKKKHVKKFCCIEEYDHHGCGCHKCHKKKPKKVCCYFYH